ncbi:hypothetical protein FOZ62_024548, partial [Perkinsus olseni]
PPPLSPQIPGRSYSLPAPMPRRRPSDSENDRSDSRGQPLGLNMVPPTQGSFDNYELADDILTGLPQSEDEEEMMMQQAIALSLQREEPPAPSARQDSSISSQPQEADLLHLNDVDDDAVSVAKVEDGGGGEKSKVESDANRVNEEGCTVTSEQGESKDTPAKER